MVHPGECNQLCGEVATPAQGAGQGSFVPPGCDGGAFARTLNILVGQDGAKAVPQLADMNGDGNLDVVVNPRKGPSALVLAGDGSGSFAGQPVVLPQGGAFAGGWGIDVGDLNGDGMLDVAAGDHVSGALAWRNQGQMSFALATGGLPAGTYNGVGLADLNGDGDLDAIYGADQFSSGLDLVLGDGTGSWTAAAFPTSNAKNAGTFSFADHDGDGDLDVFAFGQSAQVGGVIAFVYDNDGGSFGEAAQLQGGSGNTLGNPVQGSVGDVDCDGAVDVLSGGSLHLAVAGSWQLSNTIGSTKIGHLGDLDGDGLADVVLHDEIGGLVAYRNEGGSFAVMDVGLPDATYVPPGVSGENVTPLATAYGIDLGDVNDDGKLDVVRVFCSMVSSGFSNTDYCFVEVWVRG
jgi:hypothetical protein